MNMKCMKNCFKKNEKISLASSWGLILLDLINLKTKKASFIEVRDGYSADLIAIIMK